MTQRKKIPGLIESPQTLVNGELPPTLGPYVVRWMESNLVYGPGDLQGQPYRVAPFLKRFIYRLYEYHPQTGRRLVRRAILGVPKGNSKSEIAAAIALNELAGISVVIDGKPSMRPDPDIPVAAASYEQADIVYGAARAMSEPLDDFLERYDKEILLKDAPGRLYRVAAVAGTNDGRRPTTFVADEVHEWVGNTGRVHLVLSNGLAKRTDTLELNITTAGADLHGSVAGKLYQYGKLLASGEVEDESFLFQWYEASPEWDLEDDEELLAAIAEANPAPWIDHKRIADRLRIDRIPEHEFRRYHLNQWVSAGSEWLPPNAWRDLATADGHPAPGTKVVLGFDGSYNRDATAIYGWTVPTPDNPKPHGFVVGLWETDGSPDYKVPRNEVQVALRDAFKKYEVVELVCDPWRWENEIEEWAETYGDVVTEFPTNSSKRMSQACAIFYGAVVQGDITHDGDPRMERHISNTVVKETVDGAYITKDGRNSPNKIDLAVAGVIGLSRALGQEEPEWPTIELI